MLSVEQLCIPHGITALHCLRLYAMSTANGSQGLFIYNAEYKSTIYKKKKEKMKAASRSSLAAGCQLNRRGGDNGPMKETKQVQKKGV